MVLPDALCQCRMECGAYLIKCRGATAINAQAFADFYQLCREFINANLSEYAVAEMLNQHLLTEHFFRTVFHNLDFNPPPSPSNRLAFVLLYAT